MKTSMNLNQANARVYDVGMRGRVAFLYVDQAFQLLPVTSHIVEELNTLDVILLRQQRFSLCDRLINKRLQRLIGDVLKVKPAEWKQVGGYLKVPASGRDPILLSVFPFWLTDEDRECRAESQQVLAEIRLSYPKQTNLLMFSRAMRDLYELSASESKVVSLLVQGCTTKEIASTLKVADSTLRTHLKRIFSKTETRHQAELVSKVLQYDSYVMPDSFAL